ncbi:unnamed protein product [Vitrella brassicaformis CCMP3155]|uniref:Uncharacterized protein n=1 Tax=Vitrella brassicaformis (strain CCMP3155) TaxID=1169540 RepID=A0A0G4GVH3_VITBC|nr:unnamed protein product [Vitrella brassicaformis CCMP3155]|eukprot:CEM34892.1 unnamed protein product [Vitrella brassicaformis CCMP3155]
MDYSHGNNQVVISAHSASSGRNKIIALEFLLVFNKQASKPPALPQRYFNARRQDRKAAPSGDITPRALYFTSDDIPAGPEEAEATGEGATMS